MEQLIERLDAGLLKPRTLLSRARLNNDKDWETGAITDPRWLPFYYYLAAVIKPRKVFEYGVGLGLAGACLAQGCTSLEKYVGFQLTGDEYYSPRLARSTLKEYFTGQLLLGAGMSKNTALESDKWDTIILSEIVQDYEPFWAQLTVEGWLVVDRISEQHEDFETFCRVHNRKPFVFETRYQHGIIRK